MISCEKLKMLKKYTETTLALVEEKKLTKAFLRSCGLDCKL